MGSDVSTNAGVDYESAAFDFVQAEANQPADASDVADLAAAKAAILRIRQVGFFCEFTRCQQPAHAPPLSLPPCICRLCCRGSCRVLVVVFVSPAHSNRRPADRQPT